MIANENHHLALVAGINRMGNVSRGSPRMDSAEKPGADGGAAVPPWRIMWNLPIFGRVRGPADLSLRVFQQNPRMQNRVSHER